MSLKEAVRSGGPGYDAVCADDKFAMQGPETWFASRGTEHNENVPQPTIVSAY